MPKFKIISASQMLDDLQGGNLEVVLIPAPEPQHSTHCVRAVQYENAAWYQEFCSHFRSCTGKRKRSRTFIKRQHTISALQKIIRGEKSGIYVERLLAFMRFHLKQQAERRRQRKTARAYRGGRENSILI